MDSEKIIEILSQNGVSDEEIISSSENYIVIRFCYDFDSDEKSAARAYANEESGAEEDSEDWTSNWYTSYLYDIARDNIQETIEDICEEFDIEGEFRESENEDGENTDFMRAYAIFCEDSCDVDFDEILSEYI